MAFEMAMLFFLLILPDEILTETINCNATQVWSPARTQCESYPTVYVKLVGGEKFYEGRVEVTLNESSSWSTVCADFFDNNDARVVCKMLGHDVDDEGQEPTAWASKFVEDGNGTISLDSVGCNGNETNIGACFPPPLENVWGVTDCAHSEDVGVQCGCAMTYRKKVDNTCGQCTHNCNYCDDEDRDIPGLGYWCNEDGCAQNYRYILGNCITTDLQAALQEMWPQIMMIVVAVVCGLVLLFGIVQCARKFCCKKDKHGTVAHRQSSAAKSDDVEMIKQEDGLC